MKHVFPCSLLVSSQSTSGLVTTRSYGYFCVLPQPVVEHIFGFLSGHDLNRIPLVCRTWYEICRGRCRTLFSCAPSHVSFINFVHFNITNFINAHTSTNTNKPTQQNSTKYATHTCAFCFVIFLPAQENHSPFFFWGLKSH